MEHIYSQINEQRVITKHINPKIMNGDNVELILYGAGRNAALFLDEISRCIKTPKILAIIDSKKDKQGSKLMGITIEPPNSLENYDKKTTIIVTPENDVIRITQLIKNYGFENIFYCSEFSLMVLENADQLTHQFVKNKEKLSEMLYNNKEKLDIIRSKLADAYSIEILEAFIASRFESNHDKLIYYGTKPNTSTFGDAYYPTGIFSFSSNEVFVDCGAYYGDSALEFARKISSYEYIYTLLNLSQQYMKWQKPHCKQKD